ncbi:Uncharacterized protein LOCC1_G004339 [Lachnellula occidentalis]|uniref:Ubiquitin-conjugating enzyme E2-binding protein n=1 Tax=Lachnellula occidentalis TaxID=215460 RepID=A0A8H8UBY2_9HELO|nr:Uncharacterized protein LOCC1_G004339 [Lachnellula occidentalis]
MPPPSKPLIYAELLANIRQISVIAALETPCDAATKVELSGNGQQFIMHHGGESTTLTLPGRIVLTTPLQKPALGRKELSWRLPLDSPPTRPDAEDAQSSEAPWSASKLRQDLEFLCRDCGAVVIGRGVIKIWKDLPSENWAEMMDFWHCHKPDVPEHERTHEHESNGTHGPEEPDAEKSVAPTKGYGANTKFAAISGTAFVDITTFLLTPSDSSSLEPLENQTTPAQEQKVPVRPIHCKCCSNNMGYIDEQSEGVKIWKWSIKLSQANPHPSSGLRLPQMPSISSIISTRISSVLQAQCCSRLLLHSLEWKPSPAASDAMNKMSPTLLSLWILTPTLRYSATNSPAVDEPNLSLSKLAMKVFWKEVTEDEAAKLMDTVEEVPLPSEAIQQISACLHDSALLLPPSTRKFQGWDVGLLERWEEK